MNEIAAFLIVGWSGLLVAAGVMAAPDAVQSTDEDSPILGFEGLSPGQQTVVLGQLVDLDALSADPGVAATVTISVGLTREAYEAWDGNWHDPHFLIPGELMSVPTHPRLVDTRPPFGFEALSSLQQTVLLSELGDLGALAPLFDAPDGLPFSSGVGLPTDDYEHRAGGREDQEVAGIGGANEAPREFATGTAATHYGLEGLQSRYGRYSTGDIERAGQVRDYEPAGIVTCSVQAQSPHAGEGPGRIRMIKAKANAECDFIWTGPAPAPPTIGWSLNMSLARRNTASFLGFPIWRWVAVGHARYLQNGLSPNWTPDPVSGTASGTQVFHSMGLCGNGTYRNTVAVYVIPPWPYVYTGYGAIGAEQRNREVSEC